MPEERTQRKLAAIMSADVVGWSRLMGEDEAGTLATLKRHREELIDAKIAEYGGRIVKTTGDGLLVEYRSALDAVASAIEIQDAMAARNAGVADDRQMRLRIGVNLGDVIVDGDDVFGDGVNIAARLQGLAQPGATCVSGKVHDEISGKLDILAQDLGPRRMRNISRPVPVFQIMPSQSGRGPAPSAGEPSQEIRFCMTDDGVQLAYGLVGEGPPLVKTANWLNHLEHDWDSPVWRHLFRELAKRHRFVRYDERGNGLSDWEVDDLSFETFVRDLETVVDAAGLDRFALLGVSQGCAVSIAYALRHPGRVSHLVLYGGYALGWLHRGTAEDVERVHSLTSLIRSAWGQDNPAFHQLFTSLFMPGCTAEQAQSFNALQRLTTSPEMAYRLEHAFGSIDVTALLPEVKVPTLVLHCRDDAVIPFEYGRQLAKSIPGARFVPLDGKNHLILEHDACWPKFLDEVTRFLQS